jgi:hypothetical protein
MTRKDLLTQKLQTAQQVEHKMFVARMTALLLLTFLIAAFV